MIDWVLATIRCLLDVGSNAMNEPVDELVEEEDGKDVGPVVLELLDPLDPLDELSRSQTERLLQRDREAAWLAQIPAK